MRRLHHILLAIIALLLVSNTQAEQPTSGYLGMGVDTVPESIKAHFPNEIAGAEGLLVTRFADKSPAADDGIKLYDVLITYDGKAIENPEAFISKVHNDTSGRIVTFKLLRQGKILTVPVKMGEQKTIKSVTPVTYTPPARVNIPNVPNRRMPPMPSRYPVNNHSPYGWYPKPPLPMTYQVPRTPAYTVQPQVPILNNNGKPIYPMRQKRVKEKNAWGDKRNIWDDFYTGFTGDLWDSMINAPFDMGRMPGGWRAPSLSSPDPVTVGDAVTNQLPPMAEEMGNMLDFSN